MVTAASVSPAPAPGRAQGWAAGVHGPTEETLNRWVSEEGTEAQRGQETVGGHPAGSGGWVHLSPILPF